MIALCLNSGPSVLADDITIVAFGDSTTAPHRLVKHIYADMLPKLLAEHGITAKVVNSGVGSSHTGRSQPGERHFGKHALDRLEKDVTDHHPDVVIVQFGWNDSWINDWTDPLSAVPIDSFRGNLRSIVATLRRDGAEVILMSPNRPRSNVDVRQVEHTEDYVSAVRRIAAMEKVRMVDVWKAYEKFGSRSGQRVNDLLRDRIHPNDCGHKLIAELLVQQIRMIVNPTRPRNEISSPQ